MMQTKIVLFIIKIVYILSALAAILVVAAIFFRYKLYKKSKCGIASNKETAETFIEALLKFFNVKVVDIRTYEKLPNFYTYLKDFIICIRSFIDFPIFMLRIITAFFNIRILWRMMPLSIYEIWYCFLLSYSFGLSREMNTTFGLSIAIIILLCSFTHISDYFEPDKEGILKIFALPKHKLNIFEILESWLLLVISYGAIYYALAIKNPSSFSRNIGIFDSIYFSFVTISTLGYGDIAPKSFLAKFFSIAEVTSGFVFVIIAMTIFINIWIKKRIPSNE